MSVRQYIGARYVTKIYENSLDPSSAEWEAGVTYEPLTMVTYLNSSYLSKKEVPGAIGDPASNPSYWVVTGAYNGQILNLQNQIDAINLILGNVTSSPNVKNMTNRKFVFVGDSYGTEPTPATSSIGEVINILGLSNDQYHNLSVSGATMSDYINQVTGYSYTDEDDITDVIVTGGINDCRDDGYLNSTLPTTIPQLITAIKTKFTNAVIWAGFSGNGYYTSQILIHDGFNYENVNNIKYLWEKYFAEDPKVIYMSNLDTWCRDLYDTDYFDAPSGGLHPMRSGIETLSNKIANYLKGGSEFGMNQIEGAYNAIQFAIAGNWVSPDKNIRYSRYNNQYHVKIASGGCSVTTPVTINDSDTKILTQVIDPNYPNHAVVNMKSVTMAAPFYYILDGESTFKNTLATFTLDGGEVYIKCPFEANGISNIKTIWYPELNFELPANAI